MPRIFSVKQDYNSVDTGFENGAADVAATNARAIAYFTAEGFTVDTTKNTLTEMDKMTRTQLDAISSYLGVALVPGDTKAVLIGKIEAAVSTLKLISLTVTSVQTAEAGHSTITVTAPAKAAVTNIYKYKSAAAAPSLKYGDEPDATWVTFASGADITPLTTAHHCAVVECNAAGTFVVGYGEVVVDATP